MPDTEYDEMNAAYKKALALMREVLLTEPAFSIPRSALQKYEDGDMTHSELDLTNSDVRCDRTR